MAKETCKSLRADLDELRSEEAEARQGYDVRMRMAEDRLRRIEEKLEAMGFSVHPPGRGWNPPAAPLAPYVVPLWQPPTRWAPTTGGKQQA